MNKSILSAFIAIGFLGSCGQQASHEQQNTESEKTTPVDHTRPIKADPILDFTDRRDFVSADRGFIATLDSGEIKAANGSIVTSMKSYDFLKADAPASVNPSLWRQSQLNAKHGLYEVMDGIYQVRAFDLSNMTIIRGDTGWIIVDPLITKEAASAALSLVNKHLGERPVIGVILTHSHIDHYGGIRGIVSAEDVQSGKVQIIAPQGFTRETVSENILASNQMSRRAGYMFGVFIPKGPKGHIGSGLGQGISLGTSGLIPPSHSITATGEKMRIDGVDIVFQMAPGAEAPEELMFYLPQFKAFCQAEEMNRNQHNLLTPRGAQIRNGLVWSKHIDRTIQMFGPEIEVSFGSHHWPTWGNSEVIDFFEKQRDTYRYIHDQTLRLANHGNTMIEIAEQLKLPKSLASEFYNRGYYGTLNFNSKAQYQLYYGWFDGNPAHLNPLPPTEGAIEYVRYMGGAKAIIEKAQMDYDKGNYRFVASVLNKVMFAEPNNDDAATLLARTYRQLGYASESGPWRDFYLTGAQELTSPLPKHIPMGTNTPDMIENLPLDLFFDLMAVKLNGPKAEGLDLKINFSFTDTGEQAALHLKNSVLNTRMKSQHKNANATIILSRNDLNRILLKQTSFQALIKTGAISIDGNLMDMANFMKLQDDFEYWFNIVRP